MSPFEKSPHPKETKEEITEQAWENWSFLSIASGDQHQQLIRSDKQEVAEDWETCFDKDMAEAERMTQSIIEERLSTEENTKLLQLLERIKKQKKRIHELALSETLTPETLMDVLRRKYPDGAGSGRDQYRAEKRSPGFDEVRDFFKETTGSRKFFISDSHKTTGHVFAALADFPVPSVPVSEPFFEYDPKQTAILAFDHHGDTQYIYNYKLDKTNVMRWLVEEGYVAQVGVIGPAYIKPQDRIPGASFITGASLYREGRPEQKLFESNIVRLFEEWNRVGIRNLYLSIDVDGLCLDKLGIDATDYSPLRLEWTVFKKIAHFSKEMESTAAKDRNDPRLQIFVDKIKDELSFLEGYSQDYQGIPATWVLQCLRKARMAPFNFHIGIPDQSSDTIAVGDLVEVFGNDRRKKAQRLFVAMLEALVRLDI